MRKIFFFFAAMMVAITASATSTTLGSDNPKDTHADAISAVVSSYDTIFLKAGIYTESGRISVSNATKVIKAISDTVIIKVTKDNQVTNGAKVTYDGIFFDGSTIGSYRGFTTADASAGKELRFNNCEFYSYPKYVITTNSESCSIDSVIVTGCYFHNNTRGNIYFPTCGTENQETIYGLIVKNSTFANNDASGDWTSIVDVETKATIANNIKVLVDHCTFYNNLTKNDDHASVRTHTVLNAEVSNCIFAHPTSYERRATYMDANPSYAKNCIAYNFSVDTEHDGHTWMTQRSNCSMVNPLFVDAEHGDLTLELESPAIDAGTDGKTLGDPRWWPVITYPETDFSGTGYEFKADDATCAGQIDLITDSEPHYLRYADYANPGTASWKITATAACQVKVTLNLGTYGSHKHIFEVQLWDADGLNKLDTIAEGAAWASGPGDDGFTEENQNKTLDGYLTIPAAGTYTVKLLNNRHNSKMGIYSVTMQAIQTIYFKAGDWANDGAKFGIYAYQDALPEYFSDIMVLAENETAIYNTTIPAGYTHVVFIRMSGDATEVKWDGLWNQTEDLTIPEGKDMFTFTSWDGGADGKSTGTWSKYEYVAPVKFYIAGSMTDWDDNKIPVYDDSYTLNLAAGTYQLKVVDNGSWKGIGNLTTIPGGIYIDQDNNICFVLAAAGDVTVNYKSGELFTLEGDFVAPEVKLIGSNELGAWHAEDAVALTPASDKKTAAVTIKLANEWYDFKVIRNGEWLGKVNEGDGNYRIHSEFTTVDGLVRDYEGLKAISLQPSVVNKDYTFTWTYATGTLNVTFPSNDPTALDNTDATVKAAKVLRDGQVLIIRDGKTYNVIGLEVR